MRPRRTVLTALTVLTVAAGVIGFQVTPARAWNNPGYSIHWNVNSMTVYGMATDGHRTIIGLAQPSHMWDQDGLDLGQFGASLTPDEPLYADTGLGVSPTTGHLYVADITASIQRRIVELDASRHFVRRVPIPAEYLEASSNSIRGIAVDGQEDIYLADTDHGRILVFAPDGTLLHDWGTPGSGPGQFNQPWRLAFDGSGNLLVADRGNHRIQKIDPQGNISMYFQRSGVQAIDFGIDHAGVLYVLAAGYGVYAYDPAGTELGHWNSYGAGLHMGAVRWLVLDSDDNVYVANDLGSPGIIVKYDPRIVTTPPTGHYPPKIVLTALPPAQGHDLCERGRLAAVEDATISGDLAQPGIGPYYFVYLLVARGEGSFLTGLQCGITYQNGDPTGLGDGQRLDIFGWQLCADQEFPTPAGVPSGAPAWPGPGSGNLITWDPLNNCQRENTVVAGYFYAGAYAADNLRVIPRPVDGAAKVAYCSGGEHDIPESDLGAVSFSAGAHALGCNPVLHDCQEAVPVLPTTWSAIKQSFR